MKPPHDLKFITFLVLIPILLTLVPPVAINYMPDRWWIDIYKNSVTSGFKGEHTFYFSRSMPRTSIGHWYGEVDPPGCELSGGPTSYSTEEAENKRFKLEELIYPCEIKGTGKHTFQMCRTFPAFIFWNKTICTSTPFYHYEKRGNGWSLPKTQSELSPLEQKHPLSRPSQR